MTKAAHHFYYRRRRRNRREATAAMTNTMIPTHEFTGEQVAKRALFLAYQAAKVVGMGHLQAKEGVTENELWKLQQEPGHVYADYLYGRMVKINACLSYTDNEVTVLTSTPTSDYQSWCTTYPHYESLVGAALQSLRAEKQQQP